MGNALVANQTQGAQHHTINSLYQKAFLSVSKSAFLLTQWKASYDEIHQSLLSPMSEMEKPIALPAGPAIHVPRSVLNAPAIHQPSPSCFEEEGILEGFHHSMEMSMPQHPSDVKSAAEMLMPPRHADVGNFKSEEHGKNNRTEQV